MGGLGRILAAAAAVTVATVAIGAAGCGLLPERFAVNAPIAGLVFGSLAALEESDLDRMRVPDGFSIGIYADGLPPTARFMRFSEAGDLLVSAPRSGAIVLLERDADGDGRADGQRVVLEGLERPHGIDLRDGWLYVGEADAIARVRFDSATGGVTGAVERVVTGLPGSGNHWTKTLRFGPDGWLYLHVGSSCNVCVEEDERRATLMRFRPDGSEGAIYATGLRNSVGFDWQPGSGRLYATDNGRDLMGNDFPPCELNEIVEGGFYGWPVANGDRVPDPDFGAGQDARIAASIPPAHSFRAHNAPLGITFVRDGRVPSQYREAALVALHGSWNRTRKDGYKIVSLHWQPDGTIEERDFATGWELDDDVIGRPVDVVQGPDAAFYVSDDYAGVVWRIAFRDGEREGEGEGEGTASADLGALARATTDPLKGIAADARAGFVDEGDALFARHACATCHEPDAAAPGSAVKTLARLSSRYTIDTLVLLLETPPQPMPTPPLTPGQRHALAIYLLDRHP